MAVLEIRRRGWPEQRWRNASGVHTSAMIRTLCAALLYVFRRAMSTIDVGILTFPIERFIMPRRVRIKKVAQMKLLVFVTEYSVADPTVDALVEQGFRVTRLASTGGFLRKGNTTLLVGVEDNAVERAVTIAHRTAPGALVITLDLERYERI
jgi:hypothetical protein